MTRPYHRIEDPRQSPPEPDLCDECGWEKASNPDCPECLRVAAIREDATIERGRKDHDD
jgi:hypothetical protein